MNIIIKSLSLTLLLLSGARASENREYEAIKSKSKPYHGIKINEEEIQKRIDEFHKTAESWSEIKKEIFKFNVINKKFCDKFSSYDSVFVYHIFLDSISKNTIKNQRMLNVTESELANIIYPLYKRINEKIKIEEINTLISTAIKQSNDKWEEKKNNKRLKQIKSYLNFEENKWNSFLKIYNELKDNTQLLFKIISNIKKTENAKKDFEEFVKEQEDQRLNRKYFLLINSHYFNEIFNFDPLNLLQKEILTNTEKLSIYGNAKDTINLSNLSKNLFREYILSILNVPDDQKKSYVIYNSHLVKLDPNVTTSSVHQTLPDPLTKVIIKNGHLSFEKTSSLGIRTYLSTPPQNAKFLALDIYGNMYVSTNEKALSDFLSQKLIVGIANSLKVVNGKIENLFTLEQQTNQNEPFKNSITLIQNLSIIKYLNNFNVFRANTPTKALLNLAELITFLPAPENVTHEKFTDCEIHFEEE